MKGRQVKKRRNKGKRRDIQGGIGIAQSDASDALKAPKGPVIIGIDPGFTGALVATDNIDYFRYYPMPVIEKAKRIDWRILEQYFRIFMDDHVMPYVYLERAIPMAMGSGASFTYGRGYEALLGAIERAGMPFEEIEPSKWTRVMHLGTPVDLKPKARSLRAVRYLFPRLVRYLPVRPKTRMPLDGAVDALLIAGYGFHDQKGPRMQRLAGEPETKAHRLPFVCERCKSPGIRLYDPEVCVPCFRKERLTMKTLDFF